MPTPRNTVLETARGKASKDATRSLRFGCCCCCVSPLTRSFGFRCSFLLCEEETPQLYSLFFHDGRQGPRPTHPQRFERKPSSIPGDIQGPPCLSPSLDREPDSNFCLAQDREWVSSRSHSEGLLQAEARAREGVGAHWMRVFFPKRPQSWDTRLAAGRAEEPGGMQSSVAVAGAGPRLFPGLSCSQEPSEDSEMQRDTPGALRVPNSELGAKRAAKKEK